MNIPTIQELNNLPPAQVDLLFLRCLMSGDGLTRMCDLLDPPGLKDILSVVRSASSEDLSLDEIVERNNHIIALERAAGEDI